MLKLYKNIAGITNYWETWDKDEKTGIVHWGELGHKGQSKEVRSGIFSSFRKAIQKEINQKLQEGYNEVDLNDHCTLLIEYMVDEMGNSEDTEKQGRLINKLDQLLGWTGLGHCDGGSIGCGTMEVCCYVIDFEVAKQVIANGLLNTEFKNYTRIYDEEAE